MSTWGPTPPRWRWGSSTAIPIPTSRSRTPTPPASRSCSGAPAGPSPGRTSGRAGPPVHRGGRLQRRRRSRPGGRELPFSQTVMILLGEHRHELRRPDPCERSWHALGARGGRLRRRLGPRPGGGQHRARPRGVLPGVSVLYGGPGGSFAGPTNFAAGDGPGSVAVGDFNGDADPDLAVTNIHSNNISILLGVTAPDAYARPKAATPLEVSLVPAYRACATPNRTHGRRSPPLLRPAHPGLGPATVGTPDANGQAPVSIGAVARHAGRRLPTPPDEGRRGRGCPSATSAKAGPQRDTGGDITLALSARLTDLDRYGGDIRGTSRSRCPRRCRHGPARRVALLRRHDVRRANNPGAVDRGRGRSGGGGPRSWTAPTAICPPGVFVP